MYSIIIAVNIFVNTMIKLISIFILCSRLNKIVWNALSSEEKESLVLHLHLDIDI